MPELPYFSLTQHDRDSRYSLVLCGELDLTTAPELHEAITRLCHGGALEIEIDLRQVSFIDSTGVRAIVHARQLCNEHRAEFFVVPPEYPGAMKLFEITGVGRLMPWREPSGPPAPGPQEPSAT